MVGGPPGDGSVRLCFQYSLCRVVLMVMKHWAKCYLASSFQYSLCRVVLMVLHRNVSIGTQEILSVLALSSRFDGRLLHNPCLD